jgi:Flp pilus assembly protein CpaB
MTDRNARKFSISLGHLFLLSNLAIGIWGFIYLQWAEGQSRVKLWVPKHDLSAYTQIKPTDLTEKIVLGRTISPEIVKEIDKLRNHYTLVAISQENPISKNQLGPVLTLNHQTLLNNAFLVGIPATSSMTLGGNLKAGDIVDLTLVPFANKDRSSASPIMFPNIIILDFKLDASNHLLSNIPFVLVVALPLDRQQDYISNSSGAAFLITKKL